jgi:hypothetical protein
MTFRSAVGQYEAAVTVTYTKIMLIQRIASVAQSFRAAKSRDKMTTTKPPYEMLPALDLRRRLAIGRLPGL